MLRPYTPYIISLRPSYEPLVAGVLIELRVRVPLRLRDRHQREIVRPGCLVLPGRGVLAKPDEILAPLRLERELGEPLAQHYASIDGAQRIGRERTRAHVHHEGERP